MPDVLLRSDEAGVATLTLNRPDKRNALDGALVAALKAALDETATDPEVRVVALTGAGPDFCSGADLVELKRISQMGREDNLADARSLGALFHRMRDHPKPIVAVVRGRALAGGCGLATACDLALASEDAVFGYPEVHLGFVPALVMTILRRKVGEGRAFDLAVRGARFGSVEAERWGLVTRVVPAGSFDEEVSAFLTGLAKLPSSALEMTKRLLYELDGLGFEEGLERAAEVNADARMTEACREGVARFLDRGAR